MLKKLKPLWIFLGIIFLLWIVGRLTNALQFYNIPSSANYPALQPGDKIFSSNLIQPKYGDFICFRAEDEYFGKHIRVFRIAGKGGDKIEIRSGALYVNGKNADTDLDLAYYYILSQDELIQLQQHEDIPQESINQYTADSFQVVLYDSQIRKAGIRPTRMIAPIDRKNPSIEERFMKSWNEDHFGPVVVPADSYFVMGDNRHEAMDSRYSGFVLKKDVIGTVLGK